MRMGLSALFYPLLPHKIAKSREIPTKFDLTAQLVARRTDGWAIHIAR